MKPSHSLRLSAWGKPHFPGLFMPFGHRMQRFFNRLDSLAGPSGCARYPFLCVFLFAFFQGNGFHRAVFSGRFAAAGKFAPFRVHDLRLTQVLIQVKHSGANFLAVSATDAFFHVYHRSHIPIIFEPAVVFFDFLFFNLTAFRPEAVPLRPWFLKRTDNGQTQEKKETYCGNCRPLRAGCV